MPVDKSIYDLIKDDFEYALRSQNLSLVHQAYGSAKTAYLMNAISKEQFMELNEMIVTNCLNSPTSRRFFSEEGDGFLIKTFAKVLIDKIDIGLISTTSDIADFVYEFLEK